MNELIKELFVRVVKRKMDKTNETPEVILEQYPKLTDEEKQIIIQAIQNE